MTTHQCVDMRRSRATPCKHPAREVDDDGAWRCPLHAKRRRARDTTRNERDAEHGAVLRELAETFIRVGDGPARCALDAYLDDRYGETE